MEASNLITTKQAAERLNVSLRRVRALIEAGRLPSQQFGREHLINESDLALVADRKPGRPKTKADDVEPLVVPAVAAELKVGEVVKTKPPLKRASKKAGSP
jgi:excisionase family DNA binding protein